MRPACPSFQTAALRSARSMPRAARCRILNHSCITALSAGAQHPAHSKIGGRSTTVVGEQQAKVNAMVSSTHPCGVNNCSTPAPLSVALQVHFNLPVAPARNSIRSAAPNPQRRARQRYKLLPPSISVATSVSSSSTDEIESVADGSTAEMSSSQMRVPSALFHMLRATRFKTGPQPVAQHTAAVVPWTMCSAQFYHCSALDRSTRQLEVPADAADQNDHT